MTRHIGARHTVFSNMLNRHSLYYTASSMVWFPAQWAQEGCQCTLIMPRVTVHFGLGLSPCFPTWQFSLSWRVSRLCKTHFKLLPSKRLPPCDNWDIMNVRYGSIYGSICCILWSTFACTDANTFSKE